jgi:hypothetical protein
MKENGTILPNGLPGSRPFISRQADSLPGEFDTFFLKKGFLFLI